MLLSVPDDVVDSSRPLESQGINRHESDSLLQNKIKVKSFYDSTELRFIDGDSDDEIVHHTEQPPSIH